MYGNHFKFQELITTSTGLDNHPTCDEHLANLAVLWQILNHLREEFGRAIYVNSAYRTKEVNDRVGGAKKSYHLQGRAADIRPKDQQHLKQLYDTICSYQRDYNEFVEIIQYPTFIHIAI